MGLVIVHQLPHITTEFERCETTGNYRYIALNGGLSLVSKYMICGCLIVILSHADC